jgi:hypothetical protein
MSDLLAGSDSDPFINTGAVVAGRDLAGRGEGSSSVALGCRADRGYLLMLMFGRRNAQHMTLLTAR